jgi:hypothetical protein
VTTYTYELPGVTDKDTIRFLLQDTDPHGADEWLISDEEIQWSYETWYPVYNSHYYVAATLADTIAARYAKEATYSADGVSVSLGPVGDQFRALAASLRSQDKSLHVGGMPDVGGMAPGEAMEPGTKPFSFGKGIHDDIEVGRQDYGGIYPPEPYVYPVGVPEYEQVVEP